MARSSRQPEPQPVGVSALKQVDAAALVGVSPRALRQWRDCPRNLDGTYPGPQLVAWLVEREGNRVRQRYEMTEEGMMAIDSGDPVLRRWRLAKAEREELALAVSRGELVPADMAQNILAAVASRLRRFGEWLGKRDADAAGRLDRTIAGAGDALERELGGDA
ncbi:MAG: hypothetical protein WD294_14940 [Phycisphaeraceae bacterium]